MRKLTAKQKKVISAELKKYPTIRTVHSISPGVWSELVQLNDTEILWQEVNRYIWDWQSKHKDY